MADSFAQLLVHMDAGARSAVRLSIAHQLAARHDAALTALYAAVPSLVELSLEAGAGAVVAASMAAIDDEKRSRARAAFERAADDSAVQAAWSEVTEQPLIGAFAQQALFADLLVLGQHDACEPGSDVPSDFVESVLAESGKPALVIPYAGTPTPLGGTVVIAWKETREAARAVAAALPLLRRASKVHVLTWDEGGEPFISGARLDLDRYLRLHGVQAAFHRETGKPAEVGELLLSRAFDLGADLLVMGCYGHSRTREWVLGGTSRSILRAMTLPVLMAH